MTSSPTATLLSWDFKEHAWQCEESPTTQRNVWFINPPGVALKDSSKNIFRLTQFLGTPGACAGLWITGPASGNAITNLVLTGALKNTLTGNTNVSGSNAGGPMHSTGSTSTYPQPLNWEGNATFETFNGFADAHLYDDNSHGVEMTCRTSLTLQTDNVTNLPFLKYSNGDTEVVITFMPAQVLSMPYA